MSVAERDDLAGIDDQGPWEREDEDAAKEAAHPEPGGERPGPDDDGGGGA